MTSVKNEYLELIYHEVDEDNQDDYIHIESCNDGTIQFSTYQIGEEVAKCAMVVLSKKDDINIAQNILKHYPSHYHL